MAVSMKVKIVRYLTLKEQPEFKHLLAHLSHKALKIESVLSKLRQNLKSSQNLKMNSRWL